MLHRRVTAVERRPGRSSRRRSARLGKDTAAHRASCWPCSSRLWSVLVTSLSSQADHQRRRRHGGDPARVRPGRLLQIFAGGQVATAGLDQRRWSPSIGTAFSLTLTVLAAYGLSRPGSLLHRPLLFFFLLTFLICPGLVPSYLVVTGFGLKDSLLGADPARRRHRVQPGRDPGRSSWASRPSSSTARGIDGAGEFRILSRIVLPLSKARHRGGRPVLRGRLLERVLQRVALHRRQQQVADPAGAAELHPARADPAGGRAAGERARRRHRDPADPVHQDGGRHGDVVPALLVYPFVQRHFTKGVLTGAIKG